MIENKYVVDEIELEKVYEKYIVAMNKRSEWEQDWNECYNYALPHKSGIFSGMQNPKKKFSDIYDSTALNATNQLAGSSFLSLHRHGHNGLGLGLELMRIILIMMEKMKSLRSWIKFKGLCNLILISQIFMWKRINVIWIW